MNPAVAARHIFFGAISIQGITPAEATELLGTARSSVVKIFQFVFRGFGALSETPHHMSGDSHSHVT
jgi:hypothetical protein